MRQIRSRPGLRRLKRSALRRPPSCSGVASSMPPPQETNHMKVELFAPLTNFVSPTLGPATSSIHDPVKSVTRLVKANAMRVTASTIRLGAIQSRDMSVFGLAEKVYLISY